MKEEQVSNPCAAQSPLTCATAVRDDCTEGHEARQPVAGRRVLAEKPKVAKESSTVERGLSSVMPAVDLRQAIWKRALVLANRFRVIRTLDIAALCFPERTYKASLTAAQRAVRGLVKASLLKRYRTDRFMTVYGLTQRGVDWLEERGLVAAASVRRVSDMTNPEHRLWAQFLVVCCEARGMEALTEPELLKKLNEGLDPAVSTVQGPLTVNAYVGRHVRSMTLRPDAIAFEPDGATWFEVDRSARGAERAASLRALVLAIGVQLRTGQALRRVVIFARTDRIQQRVLSTLKELVRSTETFALAEGRRQLKCSGDGCFEVHQTVARTYRDGRVSLVDRFAGHVLVQRLPTWLPKVRVDGRNVYPMSGWFDGNYLPYRRPECTVKWLVPRSPLLNEPRGEHSD